MYLFIYKTAHVNGRYYIGRHETNNLNDGYLGSGKWVKSIKNKSTLTREIIEYSDNINDLKKLEEYYIEKYWDDPLCMNLIRGSDGWTSRDATDINNKKLKDGTHPFQTRPDGTNLAIDRVNNGTHNFQTRPDGTSMATDQLEAGIHPFQTRPNGSNLASDRVIDGTNPFLMREDGSSIGKNNCYKQLEEGTHPFQKRFDGTSVGSDMVIKGNHPFLKDEKGKSINSGLVQCVNKEGTYKKLTKEEYYSQLGSFENWEWVLNTSKEGAKRTGKDPNTTGNAKTFIFKNKRTNEEFIVIGRYGSFCRENKISKSKLWNIEKYPNYEWSCKKQ